MDQWKSTESLFPADHSSAAEIAGEVSRRRSGDAGPDRSQIPCPNPSQRVEYEARSSISARKVQKADREKLRRDRLNEQFQELGKALDPDRPKNDKATILTDTIQMLKDLTARVNRLKAECASLTEESREQRIRVLYPWAAMDPSIMSISPAYPFPISVPIPSAPLPIHSSLPPFPFFRNPSSGPIPNPCSTFMPYSQLCHAQVDQLSSQQSQFPHPSSSRSRPAGQQDSRNKSSTHQQPSCGGERSDNHSDVATELELKTPGSVGPSHSKMANDKDLSSEMRKGKQRQSEKKESGFAAEGSSSSRSSSSSGGVQQSSSNSVEDGSVADK
ncbi:Transcription factor bHLH121 [Ananas comosus]|uniref:Transcription factor bHLH121 n=1 Tax=Ananas comosus TaxID=4615 RepID=A0A199VIY5_ANACO|nr:Transcription factor bHLH121 [Ananas comosus]